MNKQDRWRLPDGVEEMLPASAQQLELARRQITDLHYQWGYDLIMPPLIEYLDSLLTGSGETLDIQTFKLVDQMTGRMMGVRADMTPQVARIDAHLLAADDVNRLFYLGTVLRTTPDTPGGSRSPLQLGAELFGHAGVHSDSEIISLMLATLRLTGLDKPLLDLGHVGIYRGLATQSGLSEEDEVRLFNLMQRKSIPEIKHYLGTLGLPSASSEMLIALPQLAGDISVIETARAALTHASAKVQEAIEELAAIVQLVCKRNPTVEIHIDLTELRGYSYHTGVVFSVYNASRGGQELARGGRYDDIGSAFGRNRPATGYSTDLKELLRFAESSGSSAWRPGIFAPHSDQPACWLAISELRDSGERVVTQLPGSLTTAEQAGCDRTLVFREGVWVVEEI